MDSINIIAGNNVLRSTVPGRVSNRVFVGFCALLFAVGVAGTVGWSLSMSGMGRMSMNHIRSMSWTPMTGQTWIGLVASFLAMWILMMLAMMLPSLVPILWRFRRAADRRDRTHLGPITALAGCGYFLVWVVFGMAVFVSGVSVTEVTAHHPACSRVAQVASGFLILVVGAFQFTPLKLRHLACCRMSFSTDFECDARIAVRQGLILGLNCVLCSGGLMVVQAVVGLMDLREMAFVTAAITAERLLPRAEPVARAIGILVVVFGLLRILATGIV